MTKDILAGGIACIIDRVYHSGPHQPWCLGLPPIGILPVLTKSAGFARCMVNLIVIKFESILSLFVSWRGTGLIAHAFLCSNPNTIVTSTLSLPH